MSDQDYPNSPPPGGLPPVPPEPPPAGAPPPPPPAGVGIATRGLPWEERQTVGFVPALVETLKLLVTAPQEAFHRMREKGDFVSPLLWVAILAVVVGLLQFIVGLAFGNPMARMPLEMREQLGPMAGMMSGGVGISAIILTPIMAIIALFIWSGILHLCLMATSALGQSTAGYEGTFRVAAYSYVAALVSFIPILGSLVTMVWGIFLTVVGLATVHRTTQGKALIAALIPVVLICLCCVAAAVMMGVGLAGLAANAQ